MKRRTILFSIASLLLATVVGLRVAGQEPPFGQVRVDPTTQQILDEIKSNNQIMANLEYLSDMIGPRVTGTDKTTQASRWTMEMFQKYGLENPHLEGWTIARAWYRGSASARIVSPAEHLVTIASAGWAPSTAGKVRGTVVYVNARRPEELERYRGKLKGAIVVTAEPARLPDPYEIPRSPLLSVAQPPPGQPGGGSGGGGGGGQQFARTRDEFLKAEGVAAVLRDSVKPHGLVNMTGIGGRNFDIGLLPTAFVSPEGYRLIWRLMQRGPVQMEIEMKNSFSDKPVEVYNTVAEIRGSEKPDEVVLIGAHLDSWDLGTGTTDNGTGSSAVIEAARALQKLNLKPKRSIRFVLFTGEEEGLVGSRKYVEAHKDELPKFSGILVHDTGTGRVEAIGMHGNYAAREVMDRVGVQLRSIGLSENSLRRSNGTDHLSFNEGGVPGFYCIQNPAEYGKTHHTQSDTFDKVWKDDLVQGAQVLAVWAYHVAQLPDLLPRTAQPAATQTAGPQD